MTTLTLDISTLDEELAELLRDTWTVRLFGWQVNDSPRVISPPSSTSEVNWRMPRKCTADGLRVLRNGNVVRKFTWPVVRMEANDELAVVLTLRLKSS